MSTIVKLLTSMNITFLTIMITRSDSTLELIIYGVILVVQWFAVLAMQENTRQLDREFTNIRLDFIEGVVFESKINELREAIDELDDRRENEQKGE